MKKHLKSLLALLLLACLPLSAAAHPVPDEQKDGHCSITVTMTYQGKALPGGTLALYKVGDVAEEDGNYSFVPVEAIREDMPEMGVAIPTTNFGAHHAVRGVRQIADRIIADRLVKAWPAAARIVLSLGVKQRCITHQAMVDAFPFIVQQTPGKRRFRAVILRYVKLHLCKVFFQIVGVMLVRHMLTSRC